MAINAQPLFKEKLQEDQAFEETSPSAPVLTEEEKEEYLRIFEADTFVTPLAKDLLYKRYLDLPGDDSYFSKWENTITGVLLAETRITARGGTNSIREMRWQKYALILAIDDHPTLSAAKKKFFLAKLLPGAEFT